jgi:23S rRNA (guanosine2251-2'-O)-methyltransferase
MEELERGPQIEEIIRLARAAKIPIEPARKRDLDRASATSKHQGVIALTPDPQYVPLDKLLIDASAGNDAPLIAVLDGIEDPQNLGAIARTVDGAGGHGLIIPERRAASISPGAVRASAGALEHVPVARVVNLGRALEEIKSAGVWTVGLDADADQDYTQIDLTGPTAIVIGAEGSGLSRLVREKCDLRASIPLLGELESLNASVSAAIVLYEAVRQRRNT